MKIVTHNFPNASLGWDRQALDTQAFDVAAIVFCIHPAGAALRG
jgi:hypothetical protein